MKQNKRPQNPKRGDELVLQMRGPWVSWPTCGQASGETLLGLPGQFSVFSQDGGQVWIAVIPGLGPNGECNENSDLGEVVGLHHK